MSQVGNNQPVIQVDPACSYSIRIKTNQDVVYSGHTFRLLKDLY